MKEQILLFGCDLMSANALIAAAQGLGVSAVRVERSLYNRPIGTLMQVSQARSLYARAPYIGPELEVPMAVLCGFANNGRLDAVVEGLNATGAKVVKCILTPDNARWNIITLQRELRKEQEAIAAAGPDTSNSSN
ncbi:MAG: DUF3783 domain-containing protein [Clostridiales bacterium]|nr:DUF3783 domain-containing protein [Clostridiales bacterium]